MKFTPKREEEIKRFSNLEPGRYPFTVLESTEKESKSAKNAGKIMCAVKLCVHGTDFDKHVFDYFADWFSEWKFKHFFDTTGHSKDYESGEVDPSFQGWKDWKGEVEIGVENDPKYGEKNTVIDYVVPEAKPEKPTVPSPAPRTEDDDVPF